ncbi:tRNA1(Val) (adenine(37)-N6)-methyltransferase [Thorsellia kenyensis]|uniref:tRNA1(Val) (Adenine(37)-N6)-methyltransferase n=1 Tax=Thorsellia kenyensis TaxID=1549888 RepID=A0ABV6CBB4_9GAMM
MSSGFSFKQFHVNHDQCAMKVGTDAVLLGAVAPVYGMKKALDLGTGTGVIALMLAQRNIHIYVKGLEIDKNAAVQAQQNFNNSNFAARLEVLVTSHEDYCNQKDLSYDLVVANPPFFFNAKGFEDKSRALARSLNTTSHYAWFASAFNALRLEGVFYLILPYNEFIEGIQTIFEFISVEKEDVTPSCYLFDNTLSKSRISDCNVKDKATDLFKTWEVNELIYIYPDANKKCHRIILGLKKVQISYSVMNKFRRNIFCENDVVDFFSNQAKHFYIRNTPTDYSDEMKKLISPFYLKY